MKTKLMILMTATLIAATTLAAQRGPRGHGERPGGMGAPSFDALVAALELTEGQVNQLKENARSSREAMRATMEESRPLREQIKAELDKDAPNPSVVGELTIKAHKARVELGETRKQARADARAVLTPTQQEALQTIVSSEERSREKMQVMRAAMMLSLVDGPAMGFGPRGPHGPGGPEGMRKMFRGHRGGHGPGHAEGAAQ
jgi:Spy/CpxP family protein refolding chaperone